MIEKLADMDTIHQYIPGPANYIADAVSRYPLLGPKRLAPRGLADSVAQVLARLPVAFQALKTIHVYAGQASPDVRQQVATWAAKKGNVTTVAPVRRGDPPPADFVLMIPHVDVSPVVLAIYLLSPIPFAILIPIDLADRSYSRNIFPEAPVKILEQRFKATGKIALLSSQMMWILGNIPTCTHLEIFVAKLVTPAPITGLTCYMNALAEPVADDLTAVSESSESSTFMDLVPKTVEEWIDAQEHAPNFPDIAPTLLPSVAIRGGLHLYAPDCAAPLIIVPAANREPLVRFTHRIMFHLGSAKVIERLRQSYYWCTLSKDTTKWLQDCPDCELQKARQRVATGMFAARPSAAPRSRWAMDFQGQGLSACGKTELLGIIDTEARYVVLIPLANREASHWIPLFLERVIFVHGPPEIIHSDAAPEFLSKAFAHIVEAAGMQQTTTLGHNARGNSIMEVFWRYYNRCMRLLPDDLYLHWPSFVAQVAFAYNTAAHSALDQVSPYQIYHGVQARNPFSAILATPCTVDTVLPAANLADPKEFAIAVATSVDAFVRLAQVHDNYVRTQTAAELPSTSRLAR
jgi:transposase InsO family protein